MLSLRHSPFWSYLSATQKDLIREGDYLFNIIAQNHRHSFKDYSFLVFPYAKAYEGYLKQLFLDAGFISYEDYISDHYRLGKCLSPNLAYKLGEQSLYLQIRQTAGEDLARQIWNTWRLGRNQIFHYYPHNIRAISFFHAELIIDQIAKTMESAYRLLKLNPKKRHINNSGIRHSIYLNQE